VSLRSWIQSDFTSSGVILKLLSCILLCIVIQSIIAIQYNIILYNIQNRNSKRALDTHTHTHTLFSGIRQILLGNFTRNSWPFLSKEQVILEKGVCATTMLVQSKLLFDSHNTCKTVFAFDASCSLLKDPNFVASRELVDQKRLIGCSKDLDLLFLMSFIYALCFFVHSGLCQDLTLMCVVCAVQWIQKGIRTGICFLIVFALCFNTVYFKWNPNPDNYNY